MKSSQLLLLLFFPQVPCRAAVVTVDVSSLWGGTKDSFASYGQTFTPTIDGTLVGLRLNVTSSRPFTVTVWDYDSSNGQLGNLLGSQASSTSKPFSGGYGWAEVAFMTQIHQFNGQALAFTVTSSQGPVPGPAISDRSMYAGGAFFEYSGSAAVPLINRDLNFQTLVVAVPEPAATLLAGCAALGWAMRRKRPLR